MGHSQELITLRYQSPLTFKTSLKTESNYSFIVQTADFACGIVLLHCSLHGETTTTNTRNDQLRNKGRQLYTEVMRDRRGAITIN